MTVSLGFPPNVIYRHVIKTNNELIYRNMDKEQIYDRFKGCIYGQAIGDALGLGTEGMTDEDIAWKYPHVLQH